MFLFYKRTLLTLFLLISYSGVSQNLENKDFDSILKSELSSLQKQQFVDSITKLNNYSEEKLSYLYHTYARYLSKSKKSDVSIQYLNKAIVLRKKNKKNDLESLKKSLFNLGLYSRRMGAYFKAINVFEELSELPEEDRLCMKAYSELIYLNQKIGDFEKSIDYFKKVERYYLGKKDHINLYKNYIRIANVYASMKSRDSDKIIKYLKKIDSLRIYTDIAIRDEYVINLIYGNTYEETNQSKKALHHYNTSLEISKKREDSLAISKLYNNIGFLYVKENDMSRAHNALQLGLEHVGRDTRLKATIFSNYGDYYMELEDYGSALGYYQKAIQLLVYGETQKQYINPDLNEAFTSAYKLHLFEFIIQKANHWYKRYQIDGKKDYLQKALTDLEFADQLIDIIRFDTSENVSKMFWRERGAALYVQAVDVCYLLNDTEKAYFFMEKNKALLLLEHLRDQQAKTLSNLPKELVARDFKFQEEIVSAQEALANKSVVNSDQVFELKREYEQFQDSIAANYPEYSSLRKELPVLSLSDHKKTFVTEGSATLQFIISEEQAYGLVVQHDKTVLYKIADAVTLQQEIRVLSKQLQVPFETNKQLVNYVTTSNTVLKRLIPTTILEQLKGKKITIATDGNLQNIPFDALVTSVPNDLSNIPYLIHANEINYVYSFSYLLSNSKKMREPEHTFLGFAPQNFKDNSLAVLPNSVEEINSINSIFSDTVFIEEAATKANFMSNFSTYQIVHLATHSGLDNKETPWLAFNDQKISLNEIYATQNQADLVVLSACKTSQGELKTGEGVMSMARGFFFSGTNTVISTLWNINDKTTQKIVNSFYTNLKSGQSKSKALHEAKLDYISNNEGSMASPFYWSSLILIGDANEITIASKFNWTLTIILLVVLGLIIIGVSFRKRLHK